MKKSHFKKVSLGALSRMRKRTLLIGVPKSDFYSGSPKGGLKGEVKKGEVVGE